MKKLFVVNVALWMFVPVLVFATELKKTDTNITFAIEKQLKDDPIVPGHKIDVDTKQGVVTLSGEVRTYIVRQRSMKLVQRVKGVKSVVNRIRLIPVKKSDTLLKRDIKNALLLDPATDAYALKVIVKNGLVTLRGSANSWAEKNLSEKVARSVPGVNALKNEISIIYKKKRNDAEMQKEIKQLLAWDTRVDARKLDVSVKEGKVSLSGVVGSLAEKAVAYYRAWVIGVQSVDDKKIEVRYAAQAPLERTKLKMDERVSDASIKSALNLAFLQDPRLNTIPKVNVEKGVVTLHGKMTNLRATLAAVETARNTRGVKRVNDYMKVRFTKKISDREIYKRVKKKLDNQIIMKKNDVRFFVKDGVLFLRGRVNSKVERDWLLRSVYPIKGIQSVENRLLYNTYRLDRRYGRFQ